MSVWDETNIQIRSGDDLPDRGRVWERAYFDRSCKDVAIMRKSSGKRRSVVERVLGSVLGLLQAGLEGV